MRKLDSKEKSILVDDLKKHLEKIDASVLIAFYDILNDKTESFVWLIKNRYAFHYDTGWILEFVPDYRSMLIKFNSKCKRLYYKTFISILVGRSKPQTIANNISKWIKKAGYRFILCLRKDNPEKTVLLVIARHISVPIRNATRKTTKYAITKAIIEARSEKLVYPDIYRIDKMLMHYYINNELKGLKLLKRLITNERLIFKP